MDIEVNERTKIRRIESEENEMKKIILVNMITRGLMKEENNKKR